MNVVKLPSQFNIRDTYFADSMYNATNNSIFSRIIMCEPIVNSAGLHLKLQLTDVAMGKHFHSHVSTHSNHTYVPYPNNRQTTHCNNKNGPEIVAPASVVSAVQYCTEYNTEKNFAIIASIQQIEQDILQLYQRTVNPVNKMPCSHIFDTLLCGRLKICANIGASSSGNPGRTIQSRQAEFDDETGSDDFVAPPIQSLTEYENDDPDKHICQGECGECGECGDEFKKITQSQQKQQQSTIVLKISGVWESETSFGLTFKFITLTPC